MPDVIRQRRAEQLQSGTTVEYRETGNSMEPRIRSRQLLRVEPVRYPLRKVPAAQRCVPMRDRGWYERVEELMRKPGPGPQFSQRGALNALPRQQTQQGTESASGQQMTGQMPWLTALARWPGRLAKC